MIRVDCEQGTSEWARARLGVPTASQFSKIITPKKLQLSEQADKYARRLLAEQHLGEPLDNATSGLMLRGSVLEKTAVNYYEAVKDCDTEAIGFVLRDDRRVGCSPDRFVGENGLLEIKAPAPDTHIEYLLDEDGIGYKAQVQGQLWICEREWVDTLSFHPEMPPALVRQHRDEAFIKALSLCIETFLERMLEMKQRLQKVGMFAGERIPDLRVA
jgi:hypothetical protein